MRPSSPPGYITSEDDDDSKGKRTNGIEPITNACLGAATRSELGQRDREP